MRLRQSRYRRRHGETLVDGLRECGRALAGRASPVELFVESGADDPALEGLIEGYAAKGASIRFVVPAIMERLRYGERASPCVAVVRPPEWTLDRIEISDDGCVAVVEGLEKPGNLGAIIRSADGAGLAAVFAADTPVDLFGPNVIRASLGTVFSLPVCAVSAEPLKAWLQQNAFQLVAARVDAPRLYYEADLTRRTAILLGSEAHGLSSVWRGAAVEAVRLPMHGIADSLNVSATASVLFYEVLRQRAVQRPGADGEEP